MDDIPEGTTIAFDTETTGPDLFHGCRPFMVTATSRECNYVWEWPVDPETRGVTPDEDDVEEISQLIHRNRIVFHNCLFDIPMLGEMGVLDTEEYFENGDYEDTMVMAATIHNDGERALKPLATRVGVSEGDERELLRAVTGALVYAKRRGWNYAKKGNDRFPGVRSVKGGFRHFDYFMPKAICIAETEDGNEKFSLEHPYMYVCEKYATGDTERTIQIYYPMKAELEEDGLWDRYRFTMSLMPVTWAMRSRGMPLYSGKAKKIINRFNQVAKASFDKAERLLNIDNANSPKQLGDRLDELVNIEERTKTGMAKTDEDTLLDVIARDDTPSRVSRAITNLLVGRKCIKSASLGDNYLECLDRSVGKRHGQRGFGVVHPDLNPVGTPVNRYSCKNPNTQAVRKRPWDMEEMLEQGVPHMREMFGPMRGRELWAIDFDQLHLRMVAYLSNERNMVRIFEEGGDIHDEVQRIIFQEGYVPGDSGQRRLAKDIDFGFIYGANSKKITTYVNSSTVYRSLGLGEDDGRVYSRMVEKFPNAPVFLQRKMAEARELGCVMTADGLRLYLPYGKAYAAVNYYIQGTEGYLAKKAAKDCHDKLRGTDVHVIMPIHDELLFDAPAGSHESQPYMSWCVQAMRDVGDEIGVKCEVEVKLITDSWYSGRVLSFSEIHGMKTAA